MEKDWHEMEPTWGNLLRLKAAILCTGVRVFLLRLDLCRMEAALWLIRAEDRFLESFFGTVRQ